MTRRDRIRIHCHESASGAWRHDAWLAATAGRVLGWLAIASCLVVGGLVRPTSASAPGGVERGDDVDFRIGMAYGPRVTSAYENRPTPLFYGGGFLVKVPVFETLVGMNAQGHPTAGLALRWVESEDGRVFTLYLRPDARFHDGRPCGADAVAAHFRRLGSDEDMFIGMFRYLESVEPVGETGVRFTLRRSYPLLTDLAIVNPNAVVVPDAARDAEPAVMVGTGPFRFESFRPMDRAVYRRYDDYGGRQPEIGSFAIDLLVGASNRTGVLSWAIERGHVDAIIEGWTPAIARDAASRLVEDPRFRLIEGRGSSVRLLVFHHGRAPFDDVDNRRFVASVIDRQALVDYAENGFADAVDTVFAPGVSDWPNRLARPPADSRAAAPAALRSREIVLLAPGKDPASVLCAIEVSRQLRDRGVRVRVETNSSGPSGWDRINRRDYDLLLARTWGAPYDPHGSLIAKFAPEPEKKTAVETTAYYDDSELTDLIEASFATRSGTKARRSVYEAIQAKLDRSVAVVPLYMPRRIAVTRNYVQGLELGPNGYGIDLSGVRVRRGAETTR